jgi:hypothetical protein
MSDPAINADQPVNPGEAPVITGPAILERAPDNPYERGDVMRAGGGDAFDPRAKGLDGDAFDSLLRSRMLEGLRMGHADGFKEAAANWGRIYDEGYRRGAAEGVTSTQAFYVGHLTPILDQARARTTEILQGDDMLSEEIRHAANAVIDQLNLVANTFGC